MAWIYVVATIVLTVYSQLVVKWRVLRRGALPAGLRGKLDFFTHLLVNPWILSAVGATFIAALAWMAAMSRLPLSLSYPFVVGLTFLGIVFFSGVFFHEAITVPKLAGAVLIITGLIVGSAL
jgi:multidrug transporter EmrE-like cation transporter